VLVPFSILNLGFGSRFGIITTELQPMKISAAEALWNTQQPASFSLFQIGGFSQQNPNPSFQIAIPGLLSLLSTGSFNGKVVGLNQLQQQEEKQYGRGTNYIPPVRAIYWSMRVMAYLGTLVVLVALLGALFYRRGTLTSKRRFLWTAVVATGFPFVAALAGWVLTEAGRQPWIVQGLLKTSDANSPSVSSATIAVSLGVFALLYAALAALDFILIRRYARLDPPPLREEAPGVPALGY
jgi:cytochrome d ubiquinol oxidase subunit I